MDLAALCVKGLVELIVLVNVGLLAERGNRLDIYTDSLNYTNALLEHILGYKSNEGTISPSPIAMKMITKDYLCHLKEHMHGVYIEQVPMVYKLFDCLDVYTDE